MAAAVRAGGLVDGESCVQSRPVQVQVSPSTPRDEPLAVVVVELGPVVLLVVPAVVEVVEDVEPDVEEPDEGEPDEGEPADEPEALAEVVLEEPGLVEEVFVVEEPEPPEELVLEEPEVLVT